MTNASVLMLSWRAQTEPAQQGLQERLHLQTLSLCETIPLLSTGSLTNLTSVKDLVSGQFLTEHVTSFIIALDISFILENNCLWEAHAFSHFNSPPHLLHIVRALTS